MPNLVTPMNSLSLLLNEKLIKSPVTDFRFQRRIFVYRVEKSNVEIEIALFLEFTLFIRVTKV